MSQLRRIDRWTRWATLCALLVATLAPSLAHALRHARSETLPWSALCSASGGMRRVIVPGEPRPDQAQHAFQHCAACALHMHAAPPPVVTDAQVMRNDLAQAMPKRLRGPSTLHAWATAQPRAPPVL